jgi:hypothetical protein
VIVQFVDKSAADAAVRASANRAIRIHNAILAVEHYATNGSADLKPGQLPQHTSQASEPEDDPIWQPPPSTTPGPQAGYSSAVTAGLSGLAFDNQLHGEAAYPEVEAANGQYEAYHSEVTAEPVPEPVPEAFAAYPAAPHDYGGQPHASTQSHFSQGSQPAPPQPQQQQDPSQYYGEPLGGPHAAADGGSGAAHGHHRAGSWPSGGKMQPGGASDGSTHPLQLDAFYCPLTQALLQVRPCCAHFADRNVCEPGQ